jgi:glycosyltransferase involved in cell wall biosynthesis
MNIVVLADTESENFGWRSLIVETSNQFSTQGENHKYMVFDKECWASFYTVNSNTEFIAAGTQKKLLFSFFTPQHYTRSGLIKKFKPDIIISAGNRWTPKTSCPQICFIENPERTRPSVLASCKKILVLSQSHKNFLQTVHSLPGERIKVIAPLQTNTYDIDYPSVKEEVKKKYTEGKEFFLCNDSLTKAEFILALKNFSLFKKRQQSNMQFVFFTPRALPVFEQLEKYKYRDDVKIISPETEQIAAHITAAAYSVVLPLNEKNTLPALQALQYGVPVIAIKTPELEEIAGDTVWYTEANDPQGMGEKMMRLYTDEASRHQLIQKGVSLTQEMMRDKKLPYLWQCITDAIQ